MGGSRAGSVGSYSSGSVPVGDVLGKYTKKVMDEKITKMEQDIRSAEVHAKKRQQKLEKIAAQKKAEDIASLDSKDGSNGSNNGEEENIHTADTKSSEGNLQKRGVEEIFEQFDTDHSGLVDFEEFRAMLRHMGIKMSMPKAIKYFRMCDTDNTGKIDLEEFKVAMFAIDPDTGNPVGFTPSSLLTPLDAFEFFDEDNNGHIDEDEFFFLLQYLGLEVSEQKLEQLFSKYDADKSGYIEYPEFKKIWVSVADVKKELTERGIKVPKLATREKLSKILQDILDDEEDRERWAMAEADRWARWQMLLKNKRRASEKARRRSTTELKAALDAGGSVWVFGAGPFDEFMTLPPHELMQGGHQAVHYEVIRGMWNTRVNPPPRVPEPITLGVKHERRRREEMGLSSTEGKNASDGGSSAGQSMDMIIDNKDNHQDPEEDARTSPFAGLSVAQSTAALWGRRISSVTTSDSTAFAVSELGEGYAWGGKDHWWFSMRPDSHWQSHWRGDTTERSRLLLQTIDKTEPPDMESEKEPEVSQEDDDSEIEKLKTITTYFGVWSPPPTNQRLAYIKEELVSKINHRQVKYSLECRGKHAEDMNKTELLDPLFEDIILEKKVLGERVHRRIRQLELETVHMQEKGKGVTARSLRSEIEKKWIPLREIQAEDAAIKRANEEAILDRQFAEAEERYARWREHLKKARDETSPEFTPRGNSLEISIGGITDRAGGIRTPRANDAAVAITAGANHVLLVHRSGQLYTWGMGSSGRLGLDLLQGGNPQGDAAQATAIQAFAGRPVIAASAGYSHSAAITSHGRLYTWGSAATGKLGLGTVDRDVYCSVPTRVMFDSKCKIKEVSCGAAHTACITANGQLYVWGCGDGGRLGLGGNRLGPQFEPMLVEDLLRERIGSVSCGNSHTLVRTAVREVFEGKGAGREKVLRGGRIFQAGSTNVLGNYCPEFVPVRGLDKHIVRQVSAGYGHSCCVTAAGELYTWGNNRDGCLGLPQSLKFVDTPQLVSCLYVSPKNLAVGCPARQSSVYDDLGPDIVVDGDTSGNDARKCNCTQQDPQGWWEVDLGQLVHVHQVKIWNRCDEPTDPSLEANFYAKRLFPCWVMASQVPLNDDVGGVALLEAMNTAVARAHLKQEQRCSTWTCPDQTMARYIRIQIEGFEFLHLAQVEVFGTTGARRSPGKVTQCRAGKYVTAAVLAPIDDPADVELVYKKAVQADAFNAEILRELETFFTAYDTWGRGDAMKRCLLCKAGSLCELCALKYEFREELRDLPLGPGGSPRSLSSIVHYLLNVKKPALNYHSPAAKATGVLNAVREGFNKIFGPLKDSIQDSGSSSVSSDASDMTTEQGCSPGRGRESRNKHRDKIAKESDDGTASSSSVSSGGPEQREGTGARSRDNHRHSSLSSSPSRSSTSGTISASQATSSYSESRNNSSTLGSGESVSVTTSGSSGTWSHSTNRSETTSFSLRTGSSTGSWNSSSKYSETASSNVVGSGSRSSRGSHARGRSSGKQQPMNKVDAKSGSQTQPRQKMERTSKKRPRVTVTG